LAPPWRSAIGGECAFRLAVGGAGTPSCGLTFLAIPSATGSSLPAARAPSPRSAPLAPPRQPRAGRSGAAAAHKPPARPPEGQAGRHAPATRRAPTGLPWGFALTGIMAHCAAVPAPRVVGPLACGCRTPRPSRRRRRSIFGLPLPRGLPRLTGGGSNPAGRRASRLESADL